MGYAYIEEETLRAAGEHHNAALDETETSGLYKGTTSLRRAQCIHEELNEKTITQKLRHALVDIIARRYVDRGVALSELLKAGNRGLTHALENFELEGGLRFSTYAARCIRRNIERAIMNQPPVQFAGKQMECH